MRKTTWTLILIYSTLAAVWSLSQETWWGTLSFILWQSLVGTMLYAGRPQTATEWAAERDRWLDRR